MSIESLPAHRKATESGTVSPAVFTIRRLLRSESYIGLALRPIHARRWHGIESRIGSYSEIRNHDFSILQIGANDGRHSDPVHRFIERFGWSAVLVEPVPAQFERLENNYLENSMVKLVQAAISSDDGSTLMYSPAHSADGRNPLQGKDTIHLDVLRKHAWMVDNFDEMIDRIRVPTLSLASLVTQHCFDGIDMLVTDTEGHDKVILDQLDLGKLRPQFVMYEHCHLDREDQRALRDKFNSVGYATTTLRRDTFADYQGNL